MLYDSSGGLAQITFDANRALEVAAHMRAGRWGELYQHGSPVLHLMLWALPSYLPPGLVMAVLGMAGILVWMEALAPLPNAAQWDAYTLRALCFAGAVAQPVIYFHLHQTDVELLGMLWLGLAAWALHRSYHGWAGILFALAFGTSYKLALPICIWLLASLGGKQRYKPLAYYGIAMAALFAIAWLPSLEDLPWHRYPATLYSLLLRQGGGAGPGSASSGDYLFYLHYYGLSGLDTALPVLASLAVPMAFVRQKEAVQKWLPLVIVTVGSLLFWHLLPKAPRALLPLCIIGWAAMPAMPRRLAAWLLAGAAALQAGLALYLNVLPYRQSAYPEVSRHLQMQPSGPIHTTRSLNLLPYIDVSRHPLQVDMTCAGLPSNPAGLIILDGYCLITGCDTLPRPDGLLLLRPSPNLALPLLWLEHAEYTGHTYTQTMARRERLQSQCVVGVGKEQ